MGWGGTAGAGLHVFRGIDSFKNRSRDKGQQDNKLHLGVQIHGADYTTCNRGQRRGLKCFFNYTVCSGFG